MKTLTHTHIRTASLVVLATMVAGAAIAAPAEGEEKEKRGRRGDREERGDRGDREDHPWREEGKAFREKQHEKVRAYMETQHDAVKAQREAMRDEEDPYKAVKMMKAHRTKMQKKNGSFFEGVHKETLEFLESMFAKYEVAEEKQAEILGKVEGHYADRQAEHEERFDKFIKVLDKLAAKEDLTKKDILEAMKGLHGDRPGRGRGGRGPGDGDKGKGRRGGDRGGDKAGDKA